MSSNAFAAGMAAFENHEWSRAYADLRSLLDEEVSPPDQLEALAEAAWWCGNVGDTIRARERAFSIYTAADRNVDAARVATWLAENHAHRLQTSMARGWLSRAGHLLENEPLTPELGYLKRLQSVFAAGSEGGMSEALELADEVERIGRETGDRTLEVLGLHDRGHYLVAKGEVDEGMALMEESMVSAVAGELNPMVTGRIYCNMIETCSAMADYRRAGEWNDHAMRWCDSLGTESAYPGICRIRRSEMMRLRGSWADAEAEASRAAEELTDFGPYMAAAFDEIGMIRLNLGDLEGAEDAFRRAHALGSTPMPGMALLKLAEGDASAALAMVDSALDGTQELLARAKILPSAVEIAIAAESLRTAEDRATELDEVATQYDSELLHTFAIQGRGRIASFEGRHSDAVMLQRSAVDRLVSAGLPYEAARARCDLGLSLIAVGSPDLGHLEIDAAKQEFRRLGATADLDRLADMTEPELVAKKAVSAMMFTDIVDSTGLIGAIGDAAWADLISWHDRTLRLLIEQHHGIEVDHAGDGFFVSFDSAQDAARCAIEIQQTLRRHRKEAGFSPRVRIGVHLGSVLESDGTLVGRQVHLAARVGSAAAEDEVLISADTVAAIGDGLQIKDERMIDAKGIDDPVAVATLGWD